MAALSLDDTMRIASQGALPDALGGWLLYGRPLDQQGGLKQKSAWSFRTASRERMAVQLDTGRHVLVCDDDVVLPLKKGSDAMFPSVVLIGRARSNDIEIGHASVSKLHARFEVVDGQAFLMDAGSHNGTFVEGTRLKAHTRTAVSSTSSIMFGSCGFWLLALADLHAILARHRARSVQT